MSASGATSPEGDHGCNARVGSDADIAAKAGSMATQPLQRFGASPQTSSAYR